MSADAVNALASDQRQAQSGWLATLAGVYPFIYFGPLMVLLAYPFPYPAWRFEPPWQVFIFLLTVLPLMLGFSVGWLWRFPRWSYPYLCMSLFSLIISLPVFGLNETGIVDDLLRGAILLSVGLLALLIFITRRDLPLHGLLSDLRSDWTRLAFGMLILTSALVGSIDHDEDPVLTVFVIGPSLVLALAALLVMREPLRQRRGVILAAAMLLALLVRLGSGQFFYIIYWLVLTALVFAPFLLQRLPQPGQDGPPA